LIQIGDKTFPLVPLKIWQVEAIETLPENEQRQMLLEHFKEHAPDVELTEDNIREDLSFPEWYLVKHKLMWGRYWEKHVPLIERFDNVVTEENFLLALLEKKRLEYRAVLTLVQDSTSPESSQL